MIARNVYQVQDDCPFCLNSSNKALIILRANLIYSPTMNIHSSTYIRSLVALLTCSSRHNKYHSSA